MALSADRIRRDRERQDREYQMSKELTGRTFGDGKSVFNHRGLSNPAWNSVPMVGLRTGHNPRAMRRVLTKAQRTALWAAAEMDPEPLPSGPVTNESQVQRGAAGMLALAGLIEPSVAGVDPWEADSYVLTDLGREVVSPSPCPTCGRE